MGTEYQWMDILKIAAYIVGSGFAIGVICMLGFVGWFAWNLVKDKDDNDFNINNHN